MSDPKYSSPSDLGRGYTHPVTGDELIGVSTLIKWTNPKPYLIPWKENQVAEVAADLLLDLVDMEPPDRADVVAAILARADEQGQVASQTGTLVHEWASWLGVEPDQALPTEVGPDTPHADLSKARRMCEHYRDFLARWQIQVHYSERTVAHDVYGYAGTFDLIMSSPLIGEGLFIGDIKTTNGAKPRSDVTYQLPLYAMATEMWDAEGEQVMPMPVVSQDRGYVIKVKETGASLHKVEYRNAKYGLDMFRAISEALDHYRWVNHGDKLISSKLIHPLALKPQDVYDRIVAANSHDELLAVWSWAVSEGIWRDQHLGQVEQRIQDLGKVNDEQG